jgi:hypothetical protein
LWIRNIWIILLKKFSIDQSVAMSLSKDIGGTGGGADPNPVDRRSLRGRHRCSHTEYMMDIFGGDQSCYLTGDLNKVLIIYGRESFPEVSGVYFWCFVNKEIVWKQFGGDNWVQLVVEDVPECAVKPVESSGDGPEKFVSPAGSGSGASAAGSGSGASAPSDEASGGSSSDKESSGDESTTCVIYIGCVCGCCIVACCMSIVVVVGKRKRGRAIGFLVTCRQSMLRG